MKTIQKTVRTFGEMLEAQKQGIVDEQAVDRVRKWVQDVCCEGMFAAEIRCWTDTLADIGFDDVLIDHSIEHCKGDKVSFTCNEIDMGVLLTFLATKVKASRDKPWEHFVQCWLGEGQVKKADKYCSWLLPFYDYFSGRIVRTNNRHTTKLQIEFHHHRNETVDEAIFQLEELVKSLITKLSDSIANNLDDIRDTFDPDEDLIEECDANDWHFDENGNFEST